MCTSCSLTNGLPDPSLYIVQVPRLALKTPFRQGTIQDVAKQVRL